MKKEKKKKMKRKIPFRTIDFKEKQTNVQGILGRSMKIKWSGLYKEGRR